MDAERTPRGLAATAPAAPPAGRRAPAVVLCLALVGAVGAVYHRVGGFGFVFDDQGFLHQNPLVLKGLTADGLRWATTTFATGNWYPVTWISHMLDVQLFGLRPGPHHCVNLALHALNTVLLFLVLQRLSGRRWPSLVASALFGVHPLHVESVAWVAARKDLLSGLFWILGVGAYLRYVGRPRARSYALVLLAFVLGLLAKPMMVTFPIVLLVLDWWPLGRLARLGDHRRGWGALVLEKLPLLALATAVGVVTVKAQSSVGAVASSVLYSPAARAENALVTYAVYLGKTVWPAGLAAFYPFPLGSRPWWHPGGAALLLAGLCAAAYAGRRRCPALAAGLLWYLVTLSPAIGLVQVGGQARADRYLYLPLIGLGLVACWCVPRWLPPRVRLTGAPLAAIALAALAALAVAAGRQSESWRTPLSLYRRMLEVTRDNWVAHTGYGGELLKLGRVKEAIGHFRAAAALNFGVDYVQRNLAFALYDGGADDEALEQLRVLLHMAPGDAEAHFRLGVLLGKRRDYPGSLTHLREATRLRPRHSGGWDALGVTYGMLGSRREAEAAFREALRLDPGNRSAANNLERLGPQR